MFIRAQTRARLTTYLFTTTFMVSVLTVGGPQLLPCPANQNGFGAEGGTKKKKEQESNSQKPDWNKPVVVVNR